MSIPVGSTLPTGAAPDEPGPGALAAPGDTRSARTRHLPRLGVGGWVSVGIIVLSMVPVVLAWLKERK